MRANVACGTSPIKSASPPLFHQESPPWNALLESLPTAVYVTDLEGRITYYNDAAAEFWGCRPAPSVKSGRDLWRLYWPDATPMPYEDSPMAAVARQNIGVRGCEILAERHDGILIPFIPFLTPKRDESGIPVGVIVILADISEHRRTEAAQRDQRRELNHQFRNTLTIVHSLTSQALRQSAMPSDVRAGLEGRLLAIGRTHELLMRQNGKSVDFGSLVRGALAPSGNRVDRIWLDGDPVRVSPRMALALGMVFHELVANARKHGSLSVAAGKLTVMWKSMAANRSSRLHIDWRESGGPPVKQPISAGFGMKLIEHSVTHQFKGSARIAYDVDGLQCSLDVPTHE